MMKKETSLIQRDLRHVWHPCSQMKDYELFKPLVVSKARGSYLWLNDGRKIIDAISSWWCKSLGHQHPRIKKALLNQLDKFEHVILANTVQEVVVALSEKLAKLLRELTRVFYAGDGSSAVEIALKMSLQAKQIAGEIKKTQFIALQHGYHGETTGALSVSDVGLYRHPYQTMLFDVHFILAIPYVLHKQDPLWSDCSAQWPAIERALAPYSLSTAALIVEPIVQGAGGMKIYSQDFLRRLREWTDKHHVYLIADECMTGMGRTGKMLACEHAGITPDFLCLSKGLMSGWLPMSVVLTREEIYQLFYDDYATGKAFLHSHTYAGNALAASVALEVLTIFETRDYVARANAIGDIMHGMMQKIAEETGKLKQIRNIGALVAADIVCQDVQRRVGFEIYQKAVEFGALLRPLGNTLYWLPPLNTTLETLYKLKEITHKAICAVDF